MATRAYGIFIVRLNEAGLREEIEKRALEAHVSLRDLYEGPNGPQSISAARRSVYVWLADQGRSINEIARLFDRAPSGVWRLIRKNEERSS